MKAGLSSLTETGRQRCDGLSDGYASAWPDVRRQCAKNSGMKMPGDRWLGISAIILPLFASWLSTQIAYSSGKYPHISPLAHIGTILGIIAGVLLLTKVSFRNRKRRGIAFAIYIPLIVIISLLVGVFTACANGDCI